MVKKLLEHFTKKKYKKKTNQQKFRIEKVIKKEETNYVSNGKVMIIHLIAGLIKTMLNEIPCIFCMSQYFPKPYEPFSGDINVKVDLSHYARKTDLKNATGIDISKLAAKSNLASLNAEADKLDIGKLIPVHADLCKLSDVVKNDVVKKTAYDKLVAKVNNIGTSGFVL